MPALVFYYLAFNTYFCITFNIIFVFCRSLKCSTKELWTLPAWETMSGYWKELIMTEIHTISKTTEDGIRLLIGVLLDPREFLPLYMKRFIERREMEGEFLVPGNYQIEFKVICNKENCPVMTRPMRIFPPYP